MNTIEYLKDESVDQSLPPPKAYNDTFPFSSLTSRNFETLVYLLFKNEILNGSFKGRYDDISLMQGVRDKGRDCSLYTAGRNTGIIQCKNYSDPISKPECVKEIIKFLLYTIHDPALITDPLDFTYHLACSAGFRDEATDMLKNFRSTVLHEPDLEKWIRSVLSQPSFAILHDEELVPKLKSLLTSIRTEIITGTDIGMLLHKPENIPVTKKFFRLTSIVETEPVLEKMEGSFKRIEDSLLGSPASRLSDEELIRHLTNASHYILNYPGTFGKHGAVHLQRDVTNNIYNWIQKERSGEETADTVALLAGNAGTGKSVVMKDLCVRLREEGIPVLGIKADRYYPESLTDLQHKLLLPDSPEKMVLKLSQSFPLVVVCIDQLDALSQSLTSKRDYLQVFDRLIGAVRQDKKVRIIISTRLYDLKYDPSLQYYKDQEVFELKNLSEDEVKAVLSSAKIPYESLGSGLLTLLRNPNHLNVFLGIYHPRLLVSSINSLHTLYQELWTQKVTHHDLHGAIGCRSLLFEMASEMYSTQQIVVNEYKFKDRFPQALQHLMQSGIISAEYGELQFFHQTFYDFVFAKQFVESGHTDLPGYIKENNNSIYIRSCLKMCLSFLSAHNHESYIRSVRTILFRHGFRFHIRLLFLHHLGTEPRPSREEKILARFLYKKRPALFKHFIESVHSPGWLHFLLDNGYGLHILAPVTSWNNKLKNFFRKKQKPEEKQSLKEERFQLAYQLFHRHLPSERNIILKFLSDSKFEDHSTFCFRVLSLVNQFDSPLGLNLLEQGGEEYKKDWFRYLNILEDALDHQKERAVKLLEDFVLQQIRTDGFVDKKLNGYEQYEYQLRKLHKKLIRIDPLAAFTLGMKVIDTCVEQTSYKKFNANNSFYSDGEFDDIDLSDKENNQGYHKIYELTLGQAGEIASAHPEVFLCLYEKYKQSGSISILRVVLRGLQQTPGAYLRQIAEFLRILYSSGAFTCLSEILVYEIKELITASYTLLDRSSQVFLKEGILNLKMPRELWTGVKNGKKYTDFSYYGREKYLYLLAVPEDERNRDAELKKAFQELKRKFTSLTPQKPGRRAGIVSRVGTPLPAKAYQYLSFDDWVETCMRFDANYSRTRKTGEGSREEHARALQEEVKKRPEYHLPLIDRLASLQVDITYVIHGMEGFVAAKYDLNAVADIFIKVAHRASETIDVLRLIWLTRHFTNQKIFRRGLFDFLRHQALTNPDPDESRDDLLSQSVNCVRGAAIHELVGMWEMKEWNEELMVTAEKVADDPVNAAKAGLMVHLAYLLNIDKQRTVDIFRKIFQPGTGMVKVSGWSVQYLSFHDFDAVRPYFVEAINGSDEDALKNAVTILMHRSSQNFPGSDELLAEALNKSDNAKAWAVHVAFHNLLLEDGSIDTKSREIYLRYMDEVDSKDIRHQYAISFNHFKVTGFPVLKPILNSFATSRIGSRGIEYFFEFLYKCSRYFPVECFEILTKVPSLENPSLSRRLEKDNPVKVVVGIYNRLSQDDLHHPLMEKLLDLFDTLLLNQYYRSTITVALDAVED